MQFIERKSRSLKFYFQAIYPTIITVGILYFMVYSLISLGQSRNVTAAKRRKRCSEHENWEQCENDTKCKPMLKESEQGFDCKESVFYMTGEDMVIFLTGLAFSVSICIVYVVFIELSVRLNY